MNLAKHCFIILGILLTSCSQLVQCQGQQSQQVQNRELGEIRHNYARDGALDGYLFLPGRNSPLDNQTISAQLDSIIGPDPWQDRFFYDNIGPLPYIPREADIPNPLTCTCSDIEPQQDTKGPEDFPQDCLEVEDLGLCNNDTFIFETMPVQVPVGFCERTCGRCDCCFSLDRVATLANLNTFLTIADITGYQSDLQRPGYLATILAPTDSAFEVAFASFGITLEEAEDYVLVLKDILAYHIIPPHPYFDALWTTPFFTNDVEAETQLQKQSVLYGDEIQPLSFGTATSGPTVVGAESSANVIDPDVEACKGYITEIDNVLLPYDLDQYFGETAKECRFKQGKVFRGRNVQTGLTVESAGECCEACREDKECNIWQYCANQEGCLSPGGRFEAQGSCTLKFQAGVEEETIEPSIQLKGPNVGYISGWNIEVTTPSPAQLPSPSFVPTQQPSAASLLPSSQVPLPSIQSVITTPTEATQTSEGEEEPQSGLSAFANPAPVPIQAPIVVSTPDVVYSESAPEEISTPVSIFSTLFN